MATLVRFAIFTPLALLIYRFLPRRGQNAWLLAISYAFYVTWAWHYAAILLALTLINFAIGKQLGERPGMQRPLLIAGIALNVAALGALKYAGDVAPPEWSPALRILMPVGLSFTALQTISYLVDVHQKQTPPSGNLLDFALYLAYFPKLISGPMMRAKAFFAQIEDRRTPNHDQIMRGLSLILMGVFRKVILADTLTGMIPAGVFETPAAFTAPELWLWLLTFGFAIYYDFAGYTDAARGVSGLFGIQLPENFRYPYFARSFSDFWSRWHMTLSAWLRDYIYFPSARALRQRFRDPRHPTNVIVPPVLTMMVSGLWHAAALPMLLWGGLHGVYQVVERAILLQRPATAAAAQPVWRQIASHGVVFLLVMLAWVPFRAGPSETFTYWAGLFQWGPWLLPDARPLLVILLALGIDVLWARSDQDAPLVAWPRPARVMMTAFVLISAYLIIEAGAGLIRPFVYQGF